MSVVKVIEVLAQSHKGFDDAVCSGVQEVSRSIKNIQSVYVKDLQAKVENDAVVAYRVNLKISFLVER